MSAAGEVLSAPRGDGDGIAVRIGKLTLDAEAAEIVATEAEAAAKVLTGPLRDNALALAEAAPSGTVPDELVDTLEHLLTASLSGGRARRRYTAEGEKALARVLAATPGGKDRSAALADVNQALAALAGRELHGVRVATRVPGSHTLRIQADGIVLTLGLSSAGVTVESVAL